MVVGFIMFIPVKVSSSTTQPQWYRTNVQPQRGASLFSQRLSQTYKVRKQNETIQHDTYELYMRSGWIPCDFSTPPSSQVSYASTAEVGTDSTTRFQGCSATRKLELTALRSLGLVTEEGLFAIAQVPESS